MLFFADTAKQIQNKTTENARQLNKLNCLENNLVILGIATNDF